MRVQSLYLLLIAALMTVLVFFPLATMNATDTSNATALFDVWQISFSDTTPLPLWYFGGTTAATGFLAVVCFALRKKRKVQLRLTYVLGILTVGVVLFMALYCYELFASEAYTVDFSPLVLLPLFSLPLVWLARKGMIKDLALLESYDRMR